MNALVLTVSGELGRSFVLLVDDRPIGDLVSTLVDSAIPYWIVGDGLPTIPPHGGPVQDPTIGIVAVCSCGEYGCGHTRCHVRMDDRVVTFEQFQGDVSDTGRARRFTFPRSNYEAVIRQLVKLADEQKRADQPAR
jgi:hypothetical protein